MLTKHETAASRPFYVLGHFTHFQAANIFSIGVYGACEANTKDQLDLDL